MIRDVFLLFKAYVIELYQVDDENVDGIDQVEQILQKRAADKAAFAVIKRNRKERERDKAEVVEQNRRKDAKYLLFSQGVEEDNERKALNAVVRVKKI